MNQGYIKKIDRMIEAIKIELRTKKAGEPDSQLSPQEEDDLFDQLGALIELRKQFEE